MDFEIFVDPDWAWSTTPWRLKVDGDLKSYHLDAQSLATEITSRINTAEGTRLWKRSQR